MQIHRRATTTPSGRSLGLLILCALCAVPPSSTARAQREESAPYSSDSPEWMSEGEIAVSSARVSGESVDLEGDLVDEVMADDRLSAPARQRMAEVIASQYAERQEESGAETLSLPTGPRSAATPQALPLPDGEGSIEGMGESSSVSLGGGGLSYTLPLPVPAGRNGVTPSLSLGYSSSSGSSETGYGWSIGVASIARQTDRGLPRYDDRSQWHPGEDRFVYGGAHELVPVSAESMRELDGGVVPPDLAGWQQYRAHVEGAFMRFFRSPDFTRWVVQSPDGSRHELGILSSSDAPWWAVDASQRSLVASPDGTRIASWGLSRTSDAHGSSIYYTYAQSDGARYLADVYYLSPASCAAASPRETRACSAPSDSYGGHVRIVYEDRPDPTLSFRDGWRIRSARRVRRVEVTAAGYGVGSRSLVRRWHFAYDPRSYHSLLSSLTVEGRPHHLDRDTGAMILDGEVSEANLGDGLIGPTLPPMVFHYTGEAALARGVDGFPELDGTRHVSSASPRDGAGDPSADLFDVNADGLVDLVVTDPARFRTSDGGPAVGVYFNGFSGRDATPAVGGGFSAAISVAVPAALADTMQLRNRAIVPMDVDGDGRSDLLHMPRASSYGFFTPVHPPTTSTSPGSEGWRFVHVPVDIDGLDPRIDLSRDAERTRALDVNGDGLVDVVRTSGDAIQTWLNLGSYPGGEGRFGSAVETAAGWELSADPLESCLPVAGAPVSFAQGRDDGECDVQASAVAGSCVVRASRAPMVSTVVRATETTDNFDAFGERCAPGVSRAAPVVVRAPRDLSGELDTTYLTDIDGDGASDIVRLSEDVLEAWFNEGGVAFSARTTVDGLRWARDLDRVVRFVDVDGSGSTDVLFARARQWEWLDPMGGRRARLLERVENGLGASSRFEYGASSEDYLRDLAAAASCESADCEVFRWQGRDDGECDVQASAVAGSCVVRASRAPMVSTVVRATETTDNFDAFGVEANVSRTEYAYHDAYYEGIEQEMRGFGATDVRSVGGEGQATAVTRSYMHQGRRPSSIAADRLATNPYEAIAGSTYLTQTRDEATGAVLGQVHTTFRVHRLALGLDGREIAWSFASRTDEVRYDLTTAWQPAALGARVPFFGPGGGDQYPAVERFVVSPSGLVADATAPGWSEPLPLRSAGYYAVIASTVDAVDHVGHVLRSTSWGRVHGEWGEPLHAPEEVVQHGEVALLSPEDWMWRTTDTWVSGHGSDARLGWTSTSYDAAGDARSTVGHVSIPRAYEFEGDADGSEGFAQTAEDVVTSSAHDAWGNVTATCAGAPDPGAPATCLRYASVGRDDSYAQMVTSETIALDGQSGLTWSASFDRGIGAYTQTRDPRGATTELGYDGFGRPTYVRRPDVRGCEGSRALASRVEYSVTTRGSAEPVSVMESTTFLDCHDVRQTSVARAYVDGLGRTRAALSQGSGEHAWVRSGLVAYGARGQALRTSGPSFFDDDPRSLAAVLSPNGTNAEDWAYSGFDAFGRVWWTQPRGAVAAERSWNVYGALVVFSCDPYDVGFAPSAHVGAQTCTVIRNDGQGRVEDTIITQRRHLGGATEILRLWPSYRADGAMVSLERVQTADRAARSLVTQFVGGHRVVRTFAVDSLGRRLASTDRDTDARRAGTTVANASWRYLYNRVGDLVAVRDPRGCGQNFYYDRAGRLLGEDYVACGESEPWRDASTETVPAGAIAMDVLSAPRGVETRSYYDEYPSWAREGLEPPRWAASTVGLVTGTSDRGARTVVAYDERGLASWSARQMAMMPASPDAPASLVETLPDVVPSPAAPPLPRSFDRERTYVVETTFDHAGRPRASALPPSEEGQPIGGRIEYDTRGLPASVTLDIGGELHPIVASTRYARDGLLEEMVLGDDQRGSRGATTTTLRYDRRRRPSRLTTLREPTARVPGERTLAGVTVVIDQDFTFDYVSNLLAIRDQRIPEEWPSGFRPQNVDLTYDALWHVVGADYSYANGREGGVEDVASDYRTTIAARDDVDPMRELPAPSVTELPGTRVMSLTWEYDFLGNTTEWTDDAHAFFERSLDRITNGVDEPDGRPSALRLAGSVGSTRHAFDAVTDRGGWVEVDYGDSGNVSAMTVHGRCHDASAAALCVDAGGDVEERRATLREGCLCGVEQHYAYRHDELNQIVDARRYDRAGVGAWSLAAHLRYGYDAGGQRTVKEVRDNLGATRYAIWPYPGDYERRGLVRGQDGYETTRGSETSHLVGGARVVWTHDDPGNFSLDATHRITMPVGDLLGTTSAVIDLVSGELVEQSTYYPNGARETLLGTDVAEIPLEPAGFTGKEADEEVGLTYFGMRYLIPRLGRWATPDPLQIHAEGGGEAMNSFHYISGSLLQATDPIGLDDRDATDGREMNGVLETTADAANTLSAIADLPAARDTLRVFRAARGHGGPFAPDLFDDHGAGLILDTAKLYTTLWRADVSTRAKVLAAIDFGIDQGITEGLGRVPNPVVQVFVRSYQATRAVDDLTGGTLSAPVGWFLSEVDPFDRDDIHEVRALERRTRARYRQIDAEHSRFHDVALPIAEQVIATEGAINWTDWNAGPGLHRTVPAGTCSTDYVGRCALVPEDEVSSPTSPPGPFGSVPSAVPPAWLSGTPAPSPSSSPSFEFADQFRGPFETPGSGGGR